MTHELSDNIVNNQDSQAAYIEGVDKFKKELFMKHQLDTHCCIMCLGSWHLACNKLFATLLLGAEPADVDAAGLPRDVGFVCALCVRRARDAE